MKYLVLALLLAGCTDTDTLHEIAKQSPGSKICYSVKKRDRYCLEYIGDKYLSENKN